MGVGRGHARSALGGVEKAEKRGLAVSYLQETRVERVQGFPGSLEQALRHEVSLRRAVSETAEAVVPLGAAARGRERERRRWGRHEKLLESGRLRHALGHAPKRRLAARANATAGHVPGGRVRAGLVPA
jgi:hypothetical protein